MAENEYLISAPARDAARLILKNFHLTETGKIAANERNLAIIVDVSTQIFRVQKAVDVLVKRTPWLNRHELAGNMEQLRESLRMLELVRNGMPMYAGNSVDQPPVDDRYVIAVDKEASSNEFDRRNKVLRRVADARTPQEQTQILNRR